MHSRCMKKKSSSIKQESTKKHGAPQDELHELKILIKKNILRLPRIQTVQIMKEAVLIWDRQEYTLEIFLKKELLIT